MKSKQQEARLFNTLEFFLKAMNTHKLKNFLPLITISGNKDYRK